VACLLVAVVAWNVFSVKTIPQLKAVRTSAYPLTLAELDDWYLAVPDADNAALVYTNAFPLLAFSDSGDKEKSIADISLPPRGQVLSGNDKAELASMVESNQAALRFLHSGQTLTRSRFPINLKRGIFTLLPHLIKMKGATHVLTAESLLYAASGDNAGACRSLTAAGSLAESIADEPLLIPYLVRIACWNIIVSRMESIVNVGTLTDDQLASLQMMLGRAERSQNLARALAGERAGVVAIHIDRKMQAVAFSPAPESSGSPDKLKITAWLATRKVTGLFKKDLTFYLNAMATNIAMAELPYPERLQSGRHAVLSSPNRDPLNSYLDLPMLAKLFLRDANQTAQIRVARTALAVERHRRAHENALPANLTELVPTYLDTVPLDPADGQMLRFKKRNPGYVIYSMGSDANDDGGKELDPNNRDIFHDMTFVVLR